MALKVKEDFLPQMDKGRRQFLTEGTERAKSRTDDAGRWAL